MMIRSALCLAALAALMGCGNGGNGEPNPVLQLAGRFLPAVNNIPGVDTTVPPQPGFSSADIAANPDGFILVQVNFLGDPVLARRIADNGVNDTWLAQNGFSASYSDGIMVATRGLGEDLLAASVSGIRTALRNGGGTGTRVHDRIDDLNQIEQDSFQCTVVPEAAEDLNLGLRTVATQKYAETCLSGTLQFTNSYWIDGQGTIVTSLQFVSVEAGYVRRSSL